MSTTFAEFKRQVFLRMPTVDGKTILAAEQAINDAHKVIAMVKDFDDLMVLDTANAATVANQSSYHLTGNLGLTRPKDIYTIRYMANESSRKLDFVPISELDKVLPYTLTSGTRKPTHYTRRGNSIELYPVPDAAANLYIQHSQWPATLANETDETPYQNIDPVIVDLATDITMAILSGTSGEWFTRAKQLLGITLNDDETRPDIWWVAKPFQPSPAGAAGEYWNDPFVKRQP